MELIAIWHPITRNNKLILWWPFLLVIIVFDIFWWPFFVLRNDALAPLPSFIELCISQFFEPELTSGKIQVLEHRSGKIRGGRVALGCIPPYFDHWQYVWCVLSFLKHFAAVRCYVLICWTQRWNCFSLCWVILDILPYYSNYNSKMPGIRLYGILEATPLKRRPSRHCWQILMVLLLWTMHVWKRSENGPKFEVVIVVIIKNIPIREKLSRECCEDDLQSHLLSKYHWTSTF